MELLESDKELPEAVEPAVGGLDDPPPVLGWPSSAGRALLANAGMVATLCDRVERRSSRVPSVGKQVHPATPAWPADQRVEEKLKLGHVVPIGRGDADRQRDPTRVDQEVPLASIFFPGPSGCDRRTLWRAGPSAGCRQRFAISRRCPPSRRTPRGRLARAPGRTLPSARSGNRGWEFPSLPWAKVSPWRARSMHWWGYLWACRRRCRPGRRAGGGAEGSSASCPQRR